MKILVADDHNIVRMGMVSLLKSLKYNIVGEAASMEEMKSKVLDLKPDLLITDYDMPGGDLLDVLKLIKQQHTTLKIIVLTGVSSTAIFSRLVNSHLELNGLILKNTALDELQAAIDAVKYDRKYIQLEIRKRLSEANHDLTKRQIEILSLIVQGKTNPQISDILNIAVKTVGNHRASLMKRLNASNIAELIAASKKAGIID